MLGLRNPIHGPVYVGEKDGKFDLYRVMSDE